MLDELVLSELMPLVLLVPLVELLPIEFVPDAVLLL
jgi:hypothetical protein